MQIFGKAVAPIRVSCQLHVEVCVVDQMLEEVNVVLSKVTDVVPLNRQETQVGWKTAVVDLVQLVVRKVQVLNVVEVGQVSICGDFFDLVP